MNTNRSCVIRWVGLFLLAALAVMPDTMAWAGVKEWSNGSGDCKWASAANWSPSGAPGLNDNAVFGQVSGVCTVFTAAVSAKGILFTNASFTLNPLYDVSIYADGICMTTNGTALIKMGTAYLRQKTDWTLYVTNGAVVDITNNYRISFGEGGAGASAVRKTGGGTFMIDGGMFGFNSQFFSLAVEEGRFVATNITSMSAVFTSLTVNAGAEFACYAGVSQPLVLNNNADCTFAGTVSGALLASGTPPAASGGFRKYQWGAVKVLGQARCFDSANVWLKGGSLVLDYTGTGNFGVNKLADSQSFFTGNSVLELDGASDGAVSETNGTLIIGPTPSYGQNGGLGTILIKPGAQPTTLTFILNTTTVFAGGSGGFLRFLGVDGTSNRVLFGGSGVAPSVILGGFAVFPDGTPDYAAYYHTGSGGVTGVVKLAEAGRPTAFAATKNVLLTSGSTNLSSATAHSLKIKGSQNINLAGTALTLESGGLLQTGSAGDASVISNGTITVGQIKSGYNMGHLFVYTDKDLALDCAVNGLDATSGGLQKAGSRKLTLTRNVSLNRPVIRWFEGSLDCFMPTNLSLYASGDGFGPNSTVISNTGTLTLSPGGNFTSTLYTALCAGRINVDGGTLAIGADTAIDWPLLFLANGTSNGVLSLSNSAKVWYPKNATLTAGNVGGSGTITMNSLVGGGGTVYTLTSAGGAWQPGAPVGTLSVTGALAWAANGSQLSRLEIDVTGRANAVAGVDYDQLNVSGAVTGLNANPPSATVDLVVSVANNVGNMAGKTYTIVNAPAQNFTNTYFHSVTWAPPGSTGTVTGVNGAIIVTNLKGPATSGTIVYFR